ncbi:MAG: N-acetylmuramoyl-L-alanine amidase, partial [Clostridia bacterium]|nr:N-acetylmuramoyl-L-alanine amidase [Clostridia bacterium]
ALILEIAFVTNQNDLKKLLDDKFLDKVAQGICNGTVEALSKIE